MRIAFVPAARLLSDVEPDGEGLIAVNLLHELGSRDHELLVYCERAHLETPIPNASIVEISAHGATTALGRLAFSDRIGRDLAERHGERPVDVAHLIFPCTSDEGYAPTLPGGVPLVVGPLNGSWPRAAASSPRLAARAASLFPHAVEQRRHRATLRAAGALLVSTSDARRSLPPELRGGAIDCPFGIDASRFTPEPMPAAPIIGVCSILSERKGIRALIEAMPKVRASVPRASLRIAGTDPHRLRPDLEGLAARLGVGDAVTFLGGIDPVAVPAFLNGCRIVVQPSIGEPFGMTVVEAMACGRPVVAFPSGGPADNVVDGVTGRLAARTDPGALAEAIVTVLAEQRGAERAGDAARRRAVERYAAPRVADLIEDSYRSVTSRGRMHAS